MDLVGSSKYDLYIIIIMTDAAMPDINGMNSHTHLFNIISVTISNNLYNLQGNNEIKLFRIVSEG